MLLRKSKSAEIVLNGFLRDEPRVKAVVILADEDSKNYHSVRAYRILSLKIHFKVQLMSQIFLSLSKIYRSR